MSKIDRLRQRIALWSEEEYDRRDLIYKTRPKKLHERKDRLEKTVKPGSSPASRVTQKHYQNLKKGTRKTSGILAKPSGSKYIKKLEHTLHPHGGNLEDDIGPPGTAEYSHNQPIKDSFVSESPGYKQYKRYPDAEVQHAEEMAFVESGRKIQPRKPTRMDWRAIISAKQLKQRIAQVRLAYAGPPQDVINAFRNKEALKMHAKSKKGKELSFQTDGETLYQSGYPIAQHTETGINFSYQGHPSASTAQAGRMLGINTFHTKGKYYINGNEVDPTQYDYTDVPFKDIQEGIVKVNKNIKTVPMTPEKRQLMKDQDYFSTKARRELKDPETGEIYDQVVVQPEDQEEINRVTGLDTPLPEETFATEIHHSLPKSKAPALRRSTAGAVALSPRSHQEAHFPERFVKRSLKKARLKIARMRQRNISKGVPRIAMGALARNVMQKAKGNPLFLTERTPVGYVYDEDNNVFLDATKRADAKAIRKKHGKEGEWLGINSVTDTDFGNKPVLRDQGGLRQIERELNEIEYVQKDRPILGGYENSIEASYPVVGDEKTILGRLNKNQESSLGIDPKGTAFLLYPDGRRDQITKD